jgi:hypothetical protein
MRSAPAAPDPIQQRPHPLTPDPVRAVVDGSPNLAREVVPERRIKVELPMKPTDRVQLKTYLPRAQRDGLAEVAAERGLSVGTLIRQHVAALTGVPDTLGPQKWKGKGTRPETRRRAPPGAPQGAAMTFIYKEVRPAYGETQVSSGLGWL